jgi:hypothetical protein
MHSMQIVMSVGLSGLGCLSSCWVLNQAYAGLCVVLCELVDSTAVQQSMDSVLVPPSFLINPKCGGVSSHRKQLHEKAMCSGRGPQGSHLFSNVLSAHGQSATDNTAENCQVCSPTSLSVCLASWPPQCPEHAD